MATVDRATIDDWMQRDLDGELPAEEKRLLRRELAASAELAREQRALSELDRQLALSRIEVREGFADDLMAHLPPAAWETRRARAWRLPLALLAGLVASIAALGATLGNAWPERGLLAALAAVGDLFRTAALAGSGLLGFSWKGMRLAVQELVAGDPAAIAGLVLLLVGLNLLLYLGLRRHARPAPGAASRRDRSPGERAR